MARITVEDCSEILENRFELVAIASQRAKNIASGAPITVDRDNDKNPVVALREIAQQSIAVDKLKEMLIQESQEKVRLDEYGVELSDEEAPKSEAAQEIESLQGADPAASIAEIEEDSMYGEDDVQADD